MGPELSAVAMPAGLALVTLVLFASRIVRADGVAMLALAAAVMVGLVPAERALSGFANPIVITIGALAVLAMAIHRSGFVELPRSALARRWRLTTPVLLGSGVLVALLAAISGRVSTRASLLRMSRLPEGEGASAPVRVLNLACLLGGTLTVVGGVPNLLVSAVRADELGAPFHVLAFLPVGAVLLAVGMVLFTVISVVTRRGAASRSGSPVDQLRRARGFTTELMLPPGSALHGRPIAALEAAGEHGFHVAALVREGYRRIEGRPGWELHAGDIVVLDCEPSMLHRLMERFGLHPADGPLVRLANVSGVTMVEAVITQSSELIDHTPLSSPLMSHAGVHLLGIGRNDDHRAARLRRTRLRAGDILVLAVETEAMPQILAGLGCLLLTERRLRLGRRELAALPIVTLLAAFAAAAFGLLPLWLALLTGLLVLTLSRVLTLREVYEMVPWPGLVMLASLLPLAAAVHESTASATLARVLAPYAAAAPLAVVAAMVGVAMVASLAFGAVVAVLLLAPFAIALATASAASAVPSDMLLMAVAVGASVDMLDARGMIASLVPGPGRVLDAGWRVSLGIAVLLLVCGSAAIGWVWQA